MGRLRIQRSLGLLECLSIIMGQTLGSGIFTSNSVFLYTGSVIGGLSVFMLCGVLSALGSWTLVEMGLSLPKCGGDYIYVYEAFGSLMGFLFIWSTIIIIAPCTTAITINAFAQNIVHAILGPTQCDDLTRNVYKLVAVVGIFSVTYIHCLSVKFTTRLQNTFLYIKSTMLVLIICSGFVWMITDGVDNLKVKAAPLDVAGYGLALHHAMFSYGGWNILTVFMEEITDPEHTVRKAVKISSPLIVMFYVLVNLSYATVMGVKGVSASHMVSVDYGKLALTRLKSWAMPAMVGVATLGSISVHVMVVSRLCLAGARNGHLPELLHQINLTRLSPMPSLIFSMLLSIIMVVVPGDIFIILSFRTFVHSVFIVLSIAACIVLRKIQPDLQRPFKVPIWVPYTFIVGYIVSLIVPVILFPIPMILGITTIGLGIPVYYLVVDRRHRKLSKTMGRLTVMCQKILLTAAQDDEEDDDDDIVIKTANRLLILKRKSIVTRSFVYRK